jgi:hypothetical protein
VEINVRKNGLDECIKVGKELRWRDAGWESEAIPLEGKTYPLVGKRGITGAAGRKQAGKDRPGPHRSSDNENWPGASPVVERERAVRTKAGVWGDLGLKLWVISGRR